MCIINGGKTLLALCGEAGAVAVRGGARVRAEAVQGLWGAL